MGRLPCEHWDLRIVKSASCILAPETRYSGHLCLFHVFCFVLVCMCLIYNLYHIIHHIHFLWNYKIYGVPRSAPRYGLFFPCGVRSSWFPFGPPVSPWRSRRRSRLRWGSASPGAERGAGLDGDEVPMTERPVVGRSRVGERRCCG